MHTRRWRTHAAAGLGFLIVTPAVVAADSVKDLQIAGRALTFLENGPSGSGVLGVVFDPGKPGSVAEKNAVMGALAGGLSAGSLKLTGKAVETSSVGSVGGVAALYVTKGVNYGVVGADAKAHKIVTIGSDPACAASGGCVMSVSTEPSVQITVNRAAAAGVGAVFKSAFRMMIHEI